MTFLNAALVFGAVAAAIPLVIHLLTRSRFKTVEWGAMHLLDPVIRVNQKRFRLDRLLLLLVRCAIPVLLALCMARPVLTGFQTLRGDSPRSLVLVLDDSYSMAAVPPGDRSGGRSSFDEAVETATSLIGATPDGSDIAVIRTGGRVASLTDRPVLDQPSLVKRLRELTARSGQGEAAASISEAVSTVNTMAHADREIIVLSDFQRSNWSQVGDDAAAAITRDLNAGDVRPSITLLPVNAPRDDDAVFQNVSIDALEFPGRAISPRQPINLRAVVRNQGDVSRARIRLLVDGEEADASDVELPANGTTQVLFRRDFAVAGPKAVEVVLDTQDALSADNRRSAVIDVRDRIRVLLVDGAPGAEPLSGETDYLAIALTPLTFGGGGLSDLIETRTVSPDALNEERLAGHELIVLANISRLNGQQLDALRSYVRSGGAVLITAGDRIDTARQNENLGGDAGGVGDGLLPAAWGELRGETVTTGIAAGRFEHPALSFFNDPGRGDLTAPEVRKWFAVQPHETATVVARFDSGDPFVVEREFGKGVVMQTATAIDADWSDLPLRPVFVPLTQQIVTTLATRSAPPRNLPTGQPIVLTLPSSEASDAINVETPDGRTTTVEPDPPGEEAAAPDEQRPDQRRIARFDDTRQPGLYRLTPPGASPVPFAVTAAASESDLSFLSETEIADLADRLGGRVVESPEAYVTEDRADRYGREIWQSLLLALLVFLVLEVVLQQRFSGVRGADASPGATS